MGTDEKKTLERRSAGIERRSTGIEPRSEPERPAEIIEPRRGPPARPKSPDKAEADLGEFEAIFQSAPIAMVLVDRDRVVRRMNRAAAAFAGRPGSDLLGQVTGVALCCANEPDAPEGCGTGRPCTECPFRQLVERSFETHSSVYGVETSAPFGQAGRVEERRLRISTSFLRVDRQERTLLCLQDITDRALPPSTPRLPLKKPEP